MMVKLTAKGRFVRLFVFLISSRSSSAVAKVAAAITPSPPASATAAVSSERDSQCSAPWMMG
jgi:hypothetical protein